MATLTAPPASPSAQQPRARGFRPEIEGLRAVGALLVAIYHIWLGRVSGGVDIFFFVSGFLITGTLMRQVERTGRVNPVQFILRLAQRLLPQAVVVLLVIGVASYFILPMSRLGPTFKEMVASIFYYENWELIAKNADYLRRDDSSSVVQHFWAMSIQGQFYLIWAALFVLALWLGRRHFRQVLVVGLGLLFAGSLAFSIWFTAADQTVAYFHTGTRVWEFAAGGVLYVFVKHVDRLPDRITVPAGFLGITLIISCGLVLDVSTMFPGYLALWPIVGGALILTGGAATPRWSVTQVLSSKPFVFVGSRGFGIYLWHWPLLVFYITKTGHGTADLFWGSVILVSSIVLALITTAFVEEPLRKLKIPLDYGVTAFTALTLTVAMVGQLGTQLSQTRSADLASLDGDSEHPGPAAVADGWGQSLTFDAPFLPSIDDLESDIADLDSIGCISDSTHTVSTPVYCDLGDTRSGTTVMVVGASHAARFLEPLDKIGLAHAWHIVGSIDVGCNFQASSYQDPYVSEAAAQSCSEWNEQVLSHILAEKPDLVLTIATIAGSDGDTVPDYYTSLWSELDDNGIPTLLIRDNPRWNTALNGENASGGENLVDCLASGGGGDTCYYPRSEILQQVDPVEEAAQGLRHATVADFTDLYCDADRCPAVIGNVAVYIDSNHISRTYMYLMAPYIEPYVEKALGEDESTAGDAS